MPTPDDPYVTFIDEPRDIYRDVAEQVHRGGPRGGSHLSAPYGALHNATPRDPSDQVECSLTAGAHEYDRSPRLWAPGLNEHVAARQLERQKLKPLYTEKLPKSPAFKSVAELAQRRRDFWMKVVARSGIAIMVAAPVAAFVKGTGIFPAGAFVAGLIIFAATCFISGTRERS